MSDVTPPEAASTPNTQIFKLVDSRVQPSATGGCGCGGTGGCGGKKKTVDPGDVMEQTAHQHHQHHHQHHHGQGHGGGGCGCGGKGRHAQCREEGSSLGRGQEATGSEQVDELRVQDLPRVVRQQMFMHAVDVLPVNESLIVVAPQQPDSLFAHLQRSESHYRVQTRESGPQRWSYLITRVS